MSPQCSPGGLAVDSLAVNERHGIVLVGNPGIEHVGNHLRNAAVALGLPLQLCSSSQAFEAQFALAKFNWWFRSHRPTHLREFSREVFRTCMDGAEFLLTTGLAPVDAEALTAAGRAGVVRMNFLTDDPWNPQHTAKWFLRTLPEYDIVFSPRRANLEDLRRAGCRRVHYLPFAYVPDVHFPDPPKTPDEEALYAADVVFAGGADPERAPYFAALIEAGLRVALYGGYWGKYAGTRACDLGFATPEVVRKAVGTGRVSVCLVRRANRDGHAMRTFELAAMGACILAEDTTEHREILGPDGVAAVYFRSIPEMLEKTRELLLDESWRNSLAAKARMRICGASNTYENRLAEMLKLARA